MSSACNKSLAIVTTTKIILLKFTLYTQFGKPIMAFHLLDIWWAHQGSYRVVSVDVFVNLAWHWTCSSCADSIFTLLTMALLCVLTTSNDYNSPNSPLPSYKISTDETAILVIGVLLLHWHLPCKFLISHKSKLPSRFSTSRCDGLYYHGDGMTSSYSIWLRYHIHCYSLLWQSASSR